MAGSTYVTVLVLIAIFELLYKGWLYLFCNNTRTVTELDGPTAMKCYCAQPWATTVGNSTLHVDLDSISII
jgi:hypothetical protein